MITHGYTDGVQQTARKQNAFNS